MIEPLDPRKIGVTHNYSVTFAHVNMVKELAEALSKAEGAFVSEGEIIRRAVDALYADTFPIVEGK